MDIDVVLIAPEIPQNTGAIGRLCVCLDLHLHLIKPLGFQLDEARLKRAGLDYWQHLNYSIHDSWDGFIDTQKPARLFFASTRGKNSLYDFKFLAGDYLVFGNETSGFPEAIYQKYEDILHSIPMPGEFARSHNLANSAAIVVYEAYRQLYYTASSTISGRL